MKKSHVLLAVWSMAVIVGLYQVPLLENTIVKYNGYVNLTAYFPYSKELQQIVENKKIAVVASLDTKGLLVEEHKENIIVAKQEVVQNLTPVPALKIDKQQKCLENCKVLMIGDSVMGDVGYAFDRLVKKEQPSWKVNVSHKVSSGLTNTTYYDWQKTASILIEKNKPDYIVIMMGTNDAQGIVVNGKPYKISESQWGQEYGLRVNKFAELMQLSNAGWLWVELPVVREPKFNARLQKIRDLQANGAQDNLLETETIFGKTDGSQGVNMKYRSNDGIHLNAIGADLVAKHVLNNIMKN